eukprot:362209-Chlamydomonas_euryale.AAC.8
MQVHPLGGAAPSRTDTGGAGGHRESTHSRSMHDSTCHAPAALRVRVPSGACSRGYRCRWDNRRHRHWRMKA